MILSYPGPKNIEPAAPPQGLITVSRNVDVASRRVTANFEISPIPKLRASDNHRLRPMAN
jgi:hypothetical protein